MDGPHLHYRDCPDVEVYNLSSDEGPLSDVTPDTYTRFVAVWGCKHGVERMTAYFNYPGSLAELIEELADIHEPGDFVVALMEVESPFFALHYPAPGEGGVPWVP